MKRSRHLPFLLALFGLSAQAAATVAAASVSAATQKATSGRASSPRRHHRHSKAALLKTRTASSKKKDADFPKLPPVSSLLSTASGTLETLDAQAAALKKRTEEEEKQRNLRLTRQKKVFEGKLRSQEEESRSVVALSSSIRTEIANLQSSNDATRKRCKSLSDDNRLMRAELRILQAKVAAAQDFASISLKATDDTGASDLQVLQVPKNVRGRKALSDAGQEDDDSSESGADDDDDDDEEDTSDGPLNFLSLSSSSARMASESAAEASVMASIDKELQDGDNDGDADSATSNTPPPMSPRDLVKVLSHDVDSLSTEENDSEARLKTLFLESFRKGTRRHATLLAEQKTLNGTRASLVSLESQLHVAENHLEDIKDKLTRRIRGFGLFVQKLAHLALASPTETARGIKALPAGVVIPPKKEEKNAVSADTDGEERQTF